MLCSPVNLADLVCTWSKRKTVPAVGCAKIYGNNKHWLAGHGHCSAEVCSSGSREEWTNGSELKLKGLILQREGHSPLILLAGERCNSRHPVNCAFYCKETGLSSAFSSSKVPLLGNCLISSFLHSQQHQQSSGLPIHFNKHFLLLHEYSETFWLQQKENVGCGQLFWPQKTRNVGYAWYFWLQQRRRVGYTQWFWF